MYIGCNTEMSVCRRAALWDVSCLGDESDRCALLPARHHSLTPLPHSSVDIPHSVVSAALHSTSSLSSLSLSLSALPIICFWLFFWGLSLPALIFFWFPSPRCSLFLRQNIRERRGWDTGCVCAFVCVCAASSLCAGVYITPIRARIHRLASSVNTTAVYPRFQRQIQSR